MGFTLADKNVEILGANKGRQFKYKVVKYVGYAGNIAKQPKRSFMKKKLDAKRIMRLEKGIKKIKSKYNCLFSRNEQSILHDCQKVLKNSKRERFSFKFYFFRPIILLFKLIVKLWTK